jgi:hypothetical protein
MTQTERILDTLRRRGWVCGSEFLDPAVTGAPMLRYSARLHELRQRGFNIQRRPCINPRHHHEAQMFEWRLVAAPEPSGQIRLTG